MANLKLTEMGYRSKVMIGLDRAAYERALTTTVEIESWNSELKQKEQVVVPILRECEIEKDDDDFVIVSLDDVKWYPSYKDVEAVNDFVMEAFQAAGDDNDFNNPNFVVVLGEDGTLDEDLAIGFWHSYVYHSSEIGVF